jgi:hypothetical protein
MPKQTYSKHHPDPADESHLIEHTLLQLFPVACACSMSWRRKNMQVAISAGKTYCESTSA